MRKKALFFLIAAAVVIAAVAIPVVAMAAPAPYTGTLKNNYGLQFAGQLKCLECHTAGYADTTHGKFAAAGIGDAPATPNPVFGVGGINYDNTQSFVALGYGTGLREYLETFSDGETLAGSSVTATGYIAVVGEFESFWSVKAGGENVFDKWEYGAADGYGSAVGYEAYCGGNCHNLGYTKMAPNANTKGAGSATTWQGWATAWDSSVDTSLTQYDLRNVSGNDTHMAATSEAMYGAGVQCENCHGTGTGADVTAGGHWNSGVKINSTGNSLSTPTFKPSAAEARPLLRADVCGQCHGSYRTSNFLGYTPDQPLYKFASVQIGATEIPTEEQYAADVAGFEASPYTYNGANKRLVYRYLWPGGINSGYMYDWTTGANAGSTYQAGMKHVYFTEWSLSAHSARSKLTSMSPDASMFQKSTTLNGLGGGFLSNSSSAYRDSRCGICHAGEVYLKDRKHDPMAANFSGNNADVGYLGVECASCHVVHNAETETDGAVGMGIRTPEPGNISICEDCHKERYRTMGDPITPMVFSSITGRTAHSAQGTVLHGQGMYDVPSMTGFMSNVGCEKCHMPTTRADFPNVGLTRYEDRSFKRYSHAMKIVEPGQFGSKPWQDSCSPCHPGLSQDELTSYIEDLQAVGEELTAEASAAIVAAAPRTDGAKATLLNRAWTNYAFAGGESSGGFHNPTYTQAGLKKAVQLADSVGGSFALVTGSSSVSLGNLAFVSGKVADGDTTGADGATLQLLDGAVVVGTTSADANGNFAFTLAPTATKSYRVKWARCGDAAADLYSGFVTVTVTGVVVPPTGLPSSITIATNRTSVTTGQIAWLSGLATPTPGMVGKNMHVDVKKPGKTYWSYSSNRTIYANTSGAAAWMYKYLFKAGMAKGTYQFKAVYDGPTFDPSVSGIVSVTLR